MADRFLPRDRMSDQLSDGTNAMALMIDGVPRLSPHGRDPARSSGIRFRRLSRAVSALAAVGVA